MIYIIGHKDAFPIHLFGYNYKYINTSILSFKNTKDIILCMDKFINEFVAQYYVAKYCKPSKYIGFCHYRRIIDDHIIDKKQIINNKTQIFTSPYILYKEYIDQTIIDKPKYELISLTLDFVKFHSDLTFSTQ